MPKTCITIIEKGDKWAKSLFGELKCPICGSNDLIIEMDMDNAGLHMNSPSEFKMKATCVCKAVFLVELES